MTQTYKVFTTYATTEDKNIYFQECVKKEIVNVVVTKKQKYASVEWDLITLDNSNQMRKDDKNCSFEDDIRELYESYIKKVDFKKRQLNYQIQNCCGIIYVYNEDVEEVASSICALADKMIESNCIEFTTADEMYKDIPEHLRKHVGNKNLNLG